MNSFVGRSRELSEIRQLVASSRLVTLTGVGGVGKTRLALRAAELSGVESVVAELSSLRDPALLSAHVAAALDLHDQSSRPQLDVLADVLKERRLLLVLDSCEHLADHCAMLTQVLLAAPDLRILATSRRPLDVRGERVFQVPPLPLPGPAAHRSEATLLLTGRAPVHLDRSDDPVLAQICHRLDGIPLAIELAAIQLGALSPRRLLDALDDRFSLLRGHDRCGLPRHQMLRTTIGWSHELCEPDERLLWARLSVFSGGFDLAAAEYVCGDERLPATEIDLLLTRLVNRSLLTAEGEGRYRMMSTVAEFGLDWLRALDQEREIRRRHRDFYLRRARRGESGWSSRAQTDWHARLGRDHTNLRAALDFSLADPGEHVAGLVLAATLWYFWTACGHLREGRHYLERALELVTEPSAERTKALWVCGWIAAIQGDLVLAAARAAECHADAEAQRDRAAIAYATQVAGAAAFFAGDVDTAILQFTAATEQHRATGELHPGLLLGLPQLAMAHVLRGDLDRARAVLHECLAFCDEAGELWARSHACYTLGMVEWAAGDLASAWAHARLSLRVKRLYHDVTGTVMCVELLAWTAGGRGEHAEAARLLGAAQNLWHTFGLPLFGSPFFSAEHRECEEAARRALGGQVYEELTAEGAALPYGDAVSYCLGEWHGPVSWARV
ncbi:hypothetical protein GCM10010404_28280 [Nonomuraea africana]|uniref:Non-specific serine/threonine protein kinase n=1 Tax=Nonomuraea africana TaxID=46171 RepID=A0ABR9KFH8_9ACTN|nr:ATPase [Nonomuraea africana]MBE1560546.1 non-specific serine/threonine protein kinase [Nonomuraea africana]